MDVEQPGREEASKAYERYENNIRCFHDKLVEFFSFLNNNCIHMPRTKCRSTPKLICVRPLKKYPPPKCVLCEARFFPLVVDYKFVSEAIKRTKSPSELTKDHAERFNKLFGNRGYRLDKDSGFPQDPDKPDKPDKPDLSDTILLTLSDVRK